MWRPLTFNSTGGGVREVKCNVTLEGTFHQRTITKVAGLLMGYVTRAILNECSQGAATILTETLPWHVQYAGYTGTLPNITGITQDLIGASYRVQPEGFLACLSVTEVNHPGVAISNVTRGEVLTQRVDETATIPLQGFCAFGGEGKLSGTGTVTVLGGTAHPLIRLI